MHWYHYLACLFAGLFLTNFVPHFVKGICGDRFPTPFAKPPGKGLSSPLVNVLWSLLNLLIGCVLCRAGHLATGGDAAAASAFVGVVALSTICSVQFARKDAE